MDGGLHVFISGMVQGVGYRYATYRQALSFGLRGWVRNLPDGRVEALFEGDRDLLRQMLAWCETGPALSRVDDVQSTWTDAGEDTEGFEIAF